MSFVIAAITQAAAGLLSVSPPMHTLYVLSLYLSPDLHVQNADALQLSLCIADVLQALGAALDVRWVHEGIVKVGSFCRAQGD